MWVERRDAGLCLEKRQNEEYSASTCPLEDAEPFLKTWPTLFISLRERFGGVEPFYRSKERTSIILAHSNLLIVVNHLQFVPHQSILYAQYAIILFVIVPLLDKNFVHL